MTNLAELIKGMKKWAFYVVKYPANLDYNFNNTITAADGKNIDVDKELAGKPACCIEIYCDQNFTLKYGFEKGNADKTWPRVLIAGAWHKWSNRAYKSLRIEPVANATTSVIMSATDAKGK